MSWEHAQMGGGSSRAIHSNGSFSYASPLMDDGVASLGL
jgi:hypothetical protein